MQTLQNAIKSGKIMHAYLLVGPRGTGKTSTARLIAKAVNCELGPREEPCNECEACRMITAGTCLDVLEIDAASETGVDNVRERIIEAADYKPNFCRYKVFIIDEVHDLSKSAFDALLKTIEEPPDHVLFIFATTEFTKVPPTVRSRCQKFEFHRAAIPDLVKRLKQVAAMENLEIQPAAISAVARLADGGYRDALTLLEQLSIISNGPIELQLVYDQVGLVSDDIADSLLLAIKEGSIATILTQLDKVMQMGREARSILESLMNRLADLTRVAYGVEDDELESTAVATLNDVAVKLGRQAIVQIRGEIARMHVQVRQIQIPKLWLEAELIQLSQSLQAPKAVVQPRAEPEPVQAKSHQRPEVPKADPAPDPAKKAPLTPPEVSGELSELQVAQQTWNWLKEKIAEISKTASMRLSKTNVVSVQKEFVEVEFDRQIDLDWLSEKAAAKDKIIETWKSVPQTEAWELRFIPAQKTIESVPDPSHGAVELTVDGSKLVQAAEEVFGSGLAHPAKTGEQSE